MSGQLKEVRNRIKSVTSTQQITKAMKMVSAAKLRRAQDAITQMRPYSQKLQEMLSNIVSSLSADANLPLAVDRAPERVLLIPITSDRGLAGAYNTNVIKLTRETIREKYADQAARGHVTILPIGKKGYEYFQRNNFKLVDNFWTIFSNLSFDNVREAAVYAQEAFLRGEYDRVELVYSQFRNAATQKFVSEPFLPIPRVQRVEGSRKETDFIYEPDRETLLRELMPKILNTQVYKAILDANASEHGARMTAMDKASENAAELLRSLKISYNRARQAAITTELTEIVSGAAALQG
jgi:F-type H+-transporting ATPase subunit gamma